MCPNRLAGLVLALLIVSGTHPLAAQYFGRNKVQYERMDFSVLTTPHFDIHFYGQQAEAIEDVARMAERWYERNARFFQHDLQEPKPLIFYADHADFQQTNILEGHIHEGTGGVTESLKDRVVMPLGGSYAATDHVLGHELVHAFQFDVAKAHEDARRGGGVPGLLSLPLWLVEGMAEYLSVGRDDPHTAMWLRDALVRDDFPTILQMSRESRFFPYRFGHALWAYIGGTWGDDAVLDVFRRSLRMGFDAAVRERLDVSPDTLSVEWARAVRASYGALIEGRDDPAEVGLPLLSPATGAGRVNVAPVLSPDGRHVAFLSERDLFSIDLFLADARTGEVVRKLSSGSSDAHYDALAYIETSGTFSPDGSRFAFVVFGDGDNELMIVDMAGDVVAEVELEGIGSIANPAWSPDARRIAFTGTVGGLSDLFLLDVETHDVTQLTDDRYADYHPAWSPDGTTIAFATDRAMGTDFARLTHGELGLALIDVAGGEVRTVEAFGVGRHSNPQFSPDGGSLYFLSDQDGFSDIYRLELAGGALERITRLQTGVSGITERSQALSVAARTGELAFTVFTGFEFHVHVLPADPHGVPAVPGPHPTISLGRTLPPAAPHPDSRVAEYLANAEMGLDPEGAFPASEAAPYEATLTLDAIGRPHFEASADRYGYVIDAGASAYFSDLLGNRRLSVAVRQSGTLEDLGGQAIYADLSRTLNWAVAGGHVPTQAVYQKIDIDDRGQYYLGALRIRTSQTGAVGQVSYPFSTTRRVEFGAGLVRYGFDVEEERYFVDASGLFFTGEVEKREIETDCDLVDPEERFLGLVPCRPDRLYLGQASVGYVGDNSVFGFVSPVRGGRFRFGLDLTWGSKNFLTAMADWRRYYSPHQNLTVAVRGFHLGRYGLVEGELDAPAYRVVHPMYLGYEGHIRGYALESFRPGECRERRFEPEYVDEVCPAFSRLLGHRLAVANIELRVPFLGVEQYGLLNVPWVGIPTELVLFADGGLAWDANRPPTLELSRSSVERVPVFSWGLSARFNFLGLLVLEAYHAYPFQRPGRGSHWGFLIAPGW